jgi:hypothetical protein
MGRHLEVIYCDDVRTELGGKLSFMGVYQKDMFTTGFPIVLPKFCIHLAAVTPIENPYQKLNFQILRDNDTLAEIVLDEDQLKAAAQATTEDDEELTHIIRVGMSFTPLQLDGPCTLRIRVNTETEELKGFALNVSLHQGS